MHSQLTHTPIYLSIRRPHINLWHLPCSVSVEHISECTAAPGMSDEENRCRFSKTKRSLCDRLVLHPDQPGSVKSLITPLTALKTNQTLAWVIIDFLTATRGEAAQRTITWNKTAISFLSTCSCARVWLHPLSPFLPLNSFVDLCCGFTLKCLTAKSP